MYLLYFIGQGTRNDWQAFQTQYHIAWGLILLNIGLQYCIELRNHKKKCWNRDIIIRMAATLFTEAVLVFVAVIPNTTLGIIFSIAAIFSGIILTAISRSKSAGGKVDFMHLSERAMLFVVFTFGEMIIAVASYFDGDGMVRMEPGDRIRVVRAPEVTRILKLSDRSFLDTLRKKMTI